MKIFNKKSFFIFLFLISLNYLFSESFTYKNRFYFYFDNISQKNLDLLIDSLDQVESFFIDKFNYIPKEKLDIKIFNYVWQMEKNLGIKYWIGGYYFDYSFFIQPIDSLVKKSVLKKVIFVEYSHYFIDSYTKNNCPLWLNEMLSSYFYYLFYNKQVNLSYQIKNLQNFNDFINLQSNIYDKEKMEDFNNISIKFSIFLSKKFNDIYLSNILENLRNNVRFEEIIQNKLKKDIKEIYEKDFKNNSN